MKEQDPDKAREHVQESAGIEGASALEVEHHLSKGELRGSQLR